MQVSRLANAEDEVLQKLNTVLGKESDSQGIDLAQMRVRPTEIDYEGGDDTGIDIEETQEGVLVSQGQRYDRGMTWN